MPGSNSRYLAGAECYAHGKTDAVSLNVTEVVVIRHGETEWNAEKKIQGQLDVELNDVGRQQAIAVVKDPALRERHMGDLQCFAFHEAPKICPEAWKAFKSDKRYQEIPGGGESIDQLHDRSTSSLQRLAKKHIGERIVVVTHGAFIIELHARASSPGHSRVDITNASVNILHLSNEDDWTIKVWGDVSHLNQAEFLEYGFDQNRMSG